MVRTALILAVLVGLTTSTMMADPKVATVTPSAPAPAAIGNADPIKGTITSRNVKYQLNHIAAFETNHHGKGNERICVVVSNLPIPDADIASMKYHKDPRHLFQTHVVVWFSKEGQPISFQGWGDGNNNFSGPFDDGELKIADNHVRGFAKNRDNFPNDKYKSGFDFRFDVELAGGPELEKLAADQPNQAIYFTADMEDEENNTNANTGLGFNLLKNLKNLLQPQTEVCVGGNCGQVQFSGPCGLNPDGQFPEVGTFSVVGTPQGTIRIDSKTGEACLLTVSTDGKSAQWKRVTEGSPSAGDPSPFDIGISGPSAAPVVPNSPKAAK